MFQSWGITVLVITFAITYVSACWCVPRTDDEKFCYDEFVRVFQILDNTTTVGNDTVFNVEILYTYRTVPVKNFDETKLYTPTVSPACGVKLIKEAVYVISGYYIVFPDQTTRMGTSKCYIQLLYNQTYMPPECDEPERDFQEGDMRPKTVIHEQGLVEQQTFNISI